jgi:hypothetical protein
MIKFDFRSLGIFLVVYLAASILANTLLAKSGSRKDDDSKMKPWQTGSNSKIVKEDISKRNKFAKHFENSDGSISMFTSPHSQHYKVGNVWKDIDLTIKTSTDPAFAFENIENSFSTFYPKDITADKIVTKLPEGQLQERIDAVYIINNAGDKEYSFKRNINQTSTITENSITYNNSFSNASVRYTQQNDGRKFDFILNNKQFLNEVSSDAKYLVIEEKIELPNNWVIKTTEMGIDIFAGGTWVLNIPKPLAFETELKGKEYHSDEDLMNEGLISYSTSGSELTLVTKFSMEWLKNKNRNFPVYLDPVVNFYPQNVANATGYQSTAAGKTSGFIRITGTNTNLGWASFDITTLPAGATIASANYWGYHYTTAGDKYANIVGLQSVLPIPSTGAQLNTQILTGPNYNSNYQFGSATLNTWRVGAINGTGLANIAAEQAQGTTGLGFQYISGVATFQYQYGYNGAQIPYLQLDYSTFPCSGQPIAGTATSSLLNACGNPFNLGLTGNSTGSGMTFQWQSSPAGQNNWTNLGAVQVSPSKTVTQAAPTDYQCIVTCTNGNLSATSTVVSVGQNPVNLCYCIPVGTGVNYYITGFTTTGGLTNISNVGTVLSPNGYGNYTGMSASQIPGGTVNVNVAFVTGTHVVSVWVDWNQDGDFYDLGEAAINQASYIASPYVGSFVVPLNATVGPTRMRVRTLFILPNDPCATTIYGEAEDYTFIVGGNCITANAGIVSPASVSVCEGNVTTLTSNAIPYIGATYQWKVGTNIGGPYNNVIGGVGANTASYTIPNNLVGGTYYYVLEQTCVNCGPCSALSNEVVVTVNATPAPTGTNSVQCVPGIPTASVSSNAGAGGTGKYYWYSAMVGGTLLQSPPYGPLVSYYFNDFTSPVLVNSSIAGVASISGGVCQLTPNALSQLGSITVNASGINSNKYSVDFDLTATPVGLADGISYSFAPDANGPAASPNAEQGTGSKLRICFDSYGVMPNGAGIYILYNMALLTFSDISPGVIGYSPSTAWINAPNTHVAANIDSLGRITLIVGGVTIFNNLQLPADFVNSDKSNWVHVVKARTGGIAGAFGIDNLDIKHGLSQPGFTTYQNILNNSTDFYVSELGTNGCLSPRTLVTAAVGSPIITATPASVTVCETANVTLSGAGAGVGGTYSWSGNVQDGIPFSATVTTIYTVTGTAAGGCTGTATANVIVNPVVTGTASVSPSSICLGASATFNGVVPTSCPGGNVADFAGGYAPGNWTITNNNANGTVNTAGAPLNIVITSGTNGSNLPGTTNYFTTVGCSGTVTFNWTYTHADLFGSIFDYPRYTINGAAPITFTNFLPGGANSQSGMQTISLNAGDILELQMYTIDNDVVPGIITISNFSAPTPPVGGNVTYWDSPSGGIALGAPPITVTPVATGTITYYAEYTALGTGCINPTRTPVILTTNGNPIITASASPAIICAGGSSVLTGGGAASYAWDPGALVGSPTVTPGATTTYSVVGTDGNGCTGTATVEVTVNLSPVVTASASPSTICEGSSSVLTGGGAATYAWDPGALVGNPTVSPIVTTTYSVTGTDANGCTGTATVDVTVNPAPVLVATATPATTCTQTVVTPIASGAPTIAWSGGVTNNIPFIANATTTYTVTGTDGIGCTGSTTVLVTVNPMSGILAPASSNQSQDHGDDFNVNYYDASCDLIASVDDGAGGNILGLTTSTVTVDPGFGVHNGQPFVRRWYQITPTNNGAADVVLYINQSDFDNYNLGVALPYLPLPTSGNNADPNISNIRITKNTDAGLGNSPVVITPTVNWNGTYWELSFNTPSFSQFRVHSVNPGNVPLPATVTNFSGVKLESSDKLSWTTSSEQNNAYFNLQHSTDGTNFTTLAKVNSKAQNGNSSVSLNYSSINSKPSLGHNYYRLQQVDMDGKVSVHAQIVDLIWGATGSTVSIYPNPTTDILNIDLYAVKDQNTTVKLLDMSGRVIKQIQAKSAVGMNNIKLSMGEIASGVYTIQVYENNTLSHTSKVKKNN